MHAHEVPCSRRIIMANLDAFKEDQSVKTVDATKKIRVGIIGTGWIADAQIESYM